MWTWRDYLEAIIYLALLCFMLPMKREGETEVERQFLDYLLRFNKSYDNETTYQLRLQAFQNSLKTIDSYNKNATNDSARYGLTKYSDLHPEEFLQTHLLQNLGPTIQKRAFDPGSSSEESEERPKRSLTTLPQRVDWREKNAVSAVRNQKNCGACWAFSAIETVESMYAIKHGKLMELSVQQMIDCAANNNGCLGGDICSLLDWIAVEKIKITTEQQYPLTLKNNMCKKYNSTGGVQIEDYACQSFLDSEEFLLDLLAKNGPVSVAINAKTWQNYVEGTIQYHCDGDPEQLNHAVQIVGYDLTAKVPHYIARNTWGTDFGEKGYLKLAIGKNICGLAHEVSALKVL